MARVTRVKLIANPVAGRQARQRIQHAVEWLRAAGVEVDLTLTGARGDARRAAAEARTRGHDRVIAAGGDGTLNEVVNGLVPSAIPLAFLPLGTTNVFALEAGIPFDLEAACRIALEGPAVPVNLGVANDTRFLLMASAGLDAEAVCQVSPGLKRALGKGAYLASALRALFQAPPQPFTARTAAGEDIPCYGAIISNGRLYGGRFVIAPGASLTAASFEVCLLLKPGRRALLGAALALAAGRTLSPAAARRLQTPNLQLLGAGVAVQIDGDFFGRLPVTLRIASDELCLVMPGKGSEG
ncbi:sphingosine/diacylglycerol kinase-like protein [Desulfuromonas sp. DDH964]|uniref:diacylglycerol/lipid kinase family protein n=1 Tax=Desulfuromonas sp. DDH964 TaxID=1823759 RepID=UPI00078B95D2|nr:YegS/Rv2252/BmrU family lipid kinase [Desulfuromonas sp. DDH964]AMV73497.1 sphingosine/diacylglycerol kinase-like protein [Desulfuromonas sp. DDH964]